MRQLSTGPGHCAPVHVVLGGLLACAAIAPVTAQAPPPAAAPGPSSVPVPDELQLSKMVWSTLVAIDHANLAGNYSVLRDLSAPGFQINNDAARLGQIFASLRAQNIDLSNALLLTPSFIRTPALVKPDILRLQGYFGLRPTAIEFDLHYQWVQGRWRLFGVSINPVPLARVQPAGAKLPPR
ncbi:hypothetical protein [Sphingomonas sanxanigenens]|nr:hypothetical protein [Sphingomonas sanxanigenens]